MQNCMKTVKYLSSTCRLVSGTLGQIGVRAIRTQVSPIIRYKHPTLLGFSILTLFGLEEPKKEDELITTIKRAIILIQRHEFNKAEQMLHVALRMAQSRGDELATTYVFDAMANLALEREQLDKAKKLFIEVSQRLLRDGATEEDLRMVHISCKLARICHLKGELDSAQTGFEWCLNKLKKEQLLNDSEDVKRLIALSEEWYGKLLVEGNKAQQGLQYLKNSFDKISKLDQKDINYMVMTLNDMATVCANLNLTEKAVEYLNQGIEMAKGHNIPQIGALHVNLGLLYLRMNMVDQARKSCGYGYRLGHEAKDELIKKEAKSCLDQLNRLPR